MFTKRYFLSIIIALAFIVPVTSARPALAQQPSVTAEVDRPSVPLNQTFNFTVNVSGGSNVAEPSIPAVDGLQFQGSSRSNQFSIVNGNATSQFSYIYVFRAAREGQVIIPSITVSVDGETYTTDPVGVQVTPAINGGNATEGKELFIEAEVDNPTPYLGQQITYIFRFYQAVNLFGTPEYKSPTFSGFWNKEETSQSQSNTQIDNLAYRVTELRTILFPTIPGEQTIESAMLTIPGRMFQAGTELQTEPVVVNVQPLPQPMPERFSGAVGQINVALVAQTESGSDAQPLTVELNEAVTLRVTLEGAGNLDTMQNLTLPQLGGWRSFDSTSATDTRVANGQFVGRRTVEQLIVPTKPGAYEIPSVDYIYFDPAASEYKTITTNPIRINVQGEVDAIANAQPAPLSELEATSAAVTRIDTDIRHIKAVPATLDGASRPLTKRPLFWAMWALPLFLLLGDWASDRKARAINADPVAAQSAAALREAARQIKKARAESTDPYSSSKEIIMDYLSKKLNQPVAGLTQHSLKKRLTDWGLPPELVQEAEGLIALADMGQYAPLGNGQEHPADLLGTTEEFLKRLEQAMNGRG